jgi:hypothetical protein
VDKLDTPDIWMTLDELLARWRTWQQAQSLSDRTITERAAVVTRYADRLR